MKTSLHETCLPPVSLDDAKRRLADLVDLMAPETRSAVVLELAFALAATFQGEPVEQAMGRIADWPSRHTLRLAVEVREAKMIEAQRKNPMGVN